MLPQLKLAAIPGIEKSESKLLKPLWQPLRRHSQQKAKEGKMLQEYTLLLNQVVPWEQRVLPHLSNFKEKF